MDWTYSQGVPSALVAYNTICLECIDLDLHSLLLQLGQSFTHLMASLHWITYVSKLCSSVCKCPWNIMWQTQ